MELVKLEFIFDSILDANMNACLVHKELISTIGDTIMLEKALLLENLKVVDVVIMVGEVDVVEVVVVMEEVEAGVKATLKAKLWQSYPKQPKMNIISSLTPWKLFQLLLAL